MGQKVNPLGIRLGIVRDWTSRWYAGKKQFPMHVHTDFRVREFLKEKLAEASVSRILIERAAKKVNITIQTARPGIVIGKKGEDIEKLRQETAALLGMSVNDVRLNIAEIRKPELDSQLVADSIAQQIEKRVMFRRAMKRAVMSTMRSGALGVKVRVSGRLNGSEIAAPSGIARGAFRCTPSAPTSITVCRKRTPPTASSASRCGYSRARCSTRASSPSRRARPRPPRRRARRWPPPRRRR